MLTSCLFLSAIAGACIAQVDNVPSFDADTEPDTSLRAYSAAPQDAIPALSGSAPNQAPSGWSPTSQLSEAEPPNEESAIEIHYVIERPVTEEMRHGDKVVQVTRHVREVRTDRIAVDVNLDELDLPPDGKRAAVLAITAARHEGLLTQLKEAEGDEKKKEAAEALQANYTEHYAIETWWREQRLAELEERLEELRAQVKQRQDSEEKYVTAAMTIAELWADGIAIAPPKPGSAPEYSGSVAPIYPGPVPTMPTPNGSWNPPAAAQQLRPNITQPPSSFSATIQSSR